MEKHNKPPIFIVGLLRSGTTLLRAMLGQHSSIASGLETKWFELNWEKINEEKTIDQIERLRLFFELDKETVAKIVRESHSRLEFLEKFLSAYAARCGKPRWAEKTPASILHLDEIYSYWPNAKTIHIIRDPRDVYASMKISNRYGGVAGFAAMWCDFLESGENAKKRLNLSSDKYMEIRYENLVTHPEQTMKKVLKFVDEPWEPTVAKFEGKKDDYEKVLSITGHSSTTLKQLENPLNTSRIENWKKVVTQEEIVEIKKEISKRGLLELYERITTETETIKANAKL